MEFWKPVPDYESYYEVSSLGNVRRLLKTKAPLILKPRLHPENKYLYVTLCKTIAGKKIKKSFYIHTLVCTVFHGPKPVISVDWQCCHNDGDKYNNSESNLRWDTRVENERDKIKHGTHNRGEKHGLAKLTNENVLSIREYFHNGLSDRKLAKMFNVSASCIADIRHGRRWSHIH